MSCKMQANHIYIVNFMGIVKVFYETFFFCKLDIRKS